MIHWLRLGCVPVGVLEGRPPPEKLEALRARFRAHTGLERGFGGGGGASAFQRLGGRVGAMLRAMVRARGHSRVASSEVQTHERCRPQMLGIHHDRMDRIRLRYQQHTASGSHICE